MSTFTIRSATGRFLAHTSDMLYAFDFGRSHAEYNETECVVKNNDNGRTVRFNRYGLVVVPPHAHRDYYAGLQPCTYANCDGE